MSDFSIKAKLDERGVNTDAFEDGVVDAFNRALAGIATAAHGEWIRLAQGRLSSSRDEYVKGLQQAGSFLAKGSGEKPIYEIQLVGRMANNFEFGMPSFDMKQVRPGWLGGAKSKVAKDGSRYVTIPFRHSTSASPRMSYTGKAKAVSDPNLKTQLRKAVKKYGLDRMVRTASGQVVDGPVARLGPYPMVHPYLRGLTRVQKGISGSTAAGQRGQSSLVTWRRMSEKSSPDSWMHPGLDGAKLLNEVEGWVDKQLNTIIDQILGV